MPINPMTGHPHDIKSVLSEPEEMTLDSVGRSYYAFLIEQALTAILQARALVKDDVVDKNHELAAIERLLKEAYQAV